MLHNHSKTIETSTNGDEYNKWLWRSKTNKLSEAPPLLTPRNEDPPGDDIDENDPPPGWNELTYAEKKDILDYDIDSYWQEYYDSIYVPINYWKYIAISACFMNMIILCYI